jgi:acetylornithine deacetylase
VHWEYRAARAQDAAVIKKAIADYLECNDFAALNVSNEIELDVPQFSSQLSDSWLRMLAGCGAKLPPITVPFGSEAGIFERNRIPSVVCGPGSIDQAHRPDEWIACAALQEADGFMSKLGAWASQNGSD